MAEIWGHDTQIWANVTITESSKMLGFASKWVKLPDPSYLCRLNSNKIHHFTSKTPIPAAVPPTMLACSLRISRICAKQPWGGSFSSYKPPDPWLWIRRFFSCRLSPACCAAVPLQACRGSSLPSSSLVADYLCSPSQTWSPQRWYSWWNHSTWAGRSRNSRQYSIDPSSILQSFRKRILVKWLITIKISAALLTLSLSGTRSSV